MDPILILEGFWTQDDEMTADEFEQFLMEECEWAKARDDMDATYARLGITPPSGN